VDRVIDAVGVDAVQPKTGPAAQQLQSEQQRLQKERQEAAPVENPQGDNWHPGDAPTLVLDWAVQAAAKAGTIAIIGVYPPSVHSFPIGMAMNRNLTINMGNCNHRKYIPHLIDTVRSGVITPMDVLSQIEPLQDVITAYKTFDQRQPGWMKVELKPGA
jgi:threonine dehydrogenase-like Zn-dependent dehydrogenase